MTQQVMANGHFIAAMIYHTQITINIMVVAASLNQNNSTLKKNIQQV